MDARLQRRVQRYGWDLAAQDYARHWHGPLAGVQGELLTLAAPAPGEAVLDVACGAGVMAVAAAHAVGPTGRVVGVDLSEAMVGASRQAALDLGKGGAQRGIGRGTRRRHRGRVPRAPRSRHPESPMPRRRGDVHGPCHATA